MADSFHVIYFLEDRAQERFICALVERVFRETCGPAARIHHDPRAVRHGSRALVELRAFFQELRHGAREGGRITTPDVILVAIDSNCKGHRERAREIRKSLRLDDPFRDRVVIAAPNPHIERWYLADEAALRRAVGLRKGVTIPPYKCEKDYYKNALRSALQSEGIQVLRGGVEFAEDIVKEMGHFERLVKADKGFGDFLAALRQAMREWKSRIESNATRRP